jgi:UDP-glucose 4-epimerase
VAYGLRVNTLAGERILVTGGSGFIGRSVVPALRAAGAWVGVLDRHAYPSPEVPTVVGDITDPAVRDRAVSADLTGIVHLAAVTSVLGSLKDPALVHAVNVEATAGLLELARVRGVPRFLMASTNAVVGDVGEAVIDEDLPTRPLTPYGATKAAAEMLLSGYAGGYGMATCALRFTNVYGPGMAEKDSLVPRIMRVVRDGGAIQVYGTGGQRRDLIHVRDVVAGLLVAWHARYVGSLIIGSGRSISVAELIGTAGTVVGRPVPVEHVAPKPGEMPAVIVSIARARKLGYEPSVSLADGLATVWDEFR